MMIEVYGRWCKPVSGVRLFQRGIVLLAMKFK